MPCSLVECVFVCKYTPFFFADDGVCRTGRSTASVPLFRYFKTDGGNKTAGEVGRVRKVEEVWKDPGKWRRTQLNRT